MSKTIKANTKICEKITILALHVGCAVMSLPLDCAAETGVYLDAEQLVSRPIMGALKKQAEEENLKDKKHLKKVYQAQTMQRVGYVSATFVAPAATGLGVGLALVPEPAVTKITSAACGITAAVTRIGGDGLQKVGKRIESAELKAMTCITTTEQVKVLKTIQKADHKRQKHIKRLTRAQHDGSSAKILGFIKSSSYKAHKIAKAKRQIAADEAIISNNKRTLYAIVKPLAAIQDNAMLGERIAITRLRLDQLEQLNDKIAKRLQVQQEALLVCYTELNGNS